MIFIKKDEKRYNIGRIFFSKKQSKDLRRKAVAFFLRHSIPEKDSSCFNSPSSFPIWTAFEISAIFTAFYA